MPRMHTAAACAVTLLCQRRASRGDAMPRAKSQAATSGNRARADSDASPHLPSRRPDRTQPRDMTSYTYLISADSTRHSSRILAASMSSSRTSDLNCRQKSAAVTQRDHISHPPMACVDTSCQVIALYVISCSIRRLATAAAEAASAAAAVLTLRGVFSCTQSVSQSHCRQSQGHRNAYNYYTKVDPSVATQ